MNLLLAIPLPFRLAALFVVGAGVGSLLNLAIYGLAWRVSPNSPWSRRTGTTSANWLDHVPIFGWLGARRHSGELGRAFWVRPLLIELGTATLFAWLYWWEVDQGKLLTLWPNQQPPNLLWLCPGGISATLHLEYQSQIILICLMIVASFIDLDDRIIPDSITIPGTLAGLALAAVVPWSLLPDAIWAGPPRFIDFLKLTSPHDWQPNLQHPNTLSLWIGYSFYWGWCFALLPRYWRARRGLKTAWRIFARRLVGEPITYLILALAVLGTPLIYLGWRIGGAHWAGLLTSLTGLAVSGGIVWAVRVIGSAVLGREAMGFGDVTLMAMVGAFLGWQAGVLVFFGAPFCALLVGIGYWILRRDPEIPYGPFLCLAALFIIVQWARVWAWAERLFQLGAYLLIVVVVCLIVLTILLFGLRLLRGLFGDK